MFPNSRISPHFQRLPKSCLDSNFPAFRFTHVSATALSPWDAPRLPTQPGWRFMYHLLNPGYRVNPLFFVLLCLLVGSRSDVSSALSGSHYIPSQNSSEHAALNVEPASLNCAFPLHFPPAVDFTRSLTTLRLDPSTLARSMNR